MIQPAQIEQVARAIRRAVDAHGVPNGFTVGELCAEYGAPTKPTVTAVVLRDHVAQVAELVGYPVSYVRGRPSWVNVDKIAAGGES